MSAWPFSDLSLVITMTTLASDWSEAHNVTVSVSLSSHSVSQWLPETLICSDIRYKRESGPAPSAQVKGAPHFLCHYWPIRGQSWVPTANQRPALIIVNRACWQIQEIGDSGLSDQNSGVKITNRLGIRASKCGFVSTLCISWNLLMAHFIWWWYQDSTTI